MINTEYAGRQGLDPNCLAQCPLNAARLLGEMAVMQTPPDTWMLSDSPEDTTFGAFSLNVVRTVVDHYQIEGGPSSKGYGWSRTPGGDPMLDHLSQIQQRVNGGANLTERDVAQLHQMVAERNRRRDRFAALSPEQQQALFAQARPLLEDDFVVGMTEQFPVVKSHLRVVGLLEAREDAGSIDDAERDSAASFANCVYSLDQGPFMVARHALISCPGPWRAWTQPLFGRPKPTQVCPHGSPRDSVYTDAAKAAASEPHPEF